MSEPSHLNQTTAPRKRGKFGFVLILILMLVCFLGVVLKRQWLRAHWLAYQLDQSSTIEVKADLIARIVDQGNEGRGVLFELAEHEDAEVRKMLAGMLPSIPFESARPAYEQLLNDSENSVRESVGLDLVFMDKDGADSLIIEVARSENEPVAIDAIGLLSRISDPQAVERLVEMVESGRSAKRRAQAVESLLIWFKAHGRDAALHPNEPELSLIKPISAALAKAVRDSERFEGLLAAEKDVAAVSAFAGQSPPESVEKVKSGSERSVAELTLERLADFFNRPVAANDRSPERIAELLWNWAATPALPAHELPEAVRSISG